MATIIYNHREMEYNCRKTWQALKLSQPDFNSVMLSQENEFSWILSELTRLNAYTFEDDYAMDYGLDTLRLYVLFEGYPDSEESYREGSLEGIYKFLNRLMTLVENSITATMGIAHNERKPLHRLSNSSEDCMIRKQVEEKTALFQQEFYQAIEHHHSHGIVAAFMEYATNLAQISKKNDICIEENVLRDMMIMLSPYAPYMSEYLWQKLVGEGSVFQTQYPIWNKAEHETTQDTCIAIQVNGRTKKVIRTKADTQQSDMEALVRTVLGVHMPEGITRVVYIPGKVYNIITDSL